MKNYLLLTTILILGCQPVAYQPAPTQLNLEAPNECEVGELVRLNASGSDIIVWEIVPETGDFEAVGKRAFFSSRVGGEYLIIIAGCIDKQPMLKTHSIRVNGEIQSDSNLDSLIKTLLGRVQTQNKREEAIQLAQSFRVIGQTELSADKIIEATANVNRNALKDSLDAWKPFLDGIGAYLDAQETYDYRIVWPQIANSIEKWIDAQS